MRHRHASFLDTPVSALGIGGSRFGSILSVLDRRLSSRLMEHAFERGVNLFDTADSYGQGDSERWIGSFAKGRRDRIAILTKAGFLAPQLGTGMRVAKPMLRWGARHSTPLRRRLSARRGAGYPKTFDVGYLDQALNASLKRLRSDHVNVFLLHDPPASLVSNEDVRSWLMRVKSDGRARAIGVSCDALDAAQAFLAWDEVEVQQVTYNLSDRTAAAFIGEAAARGVNVLTRRPFAGGPLVKAGGGSAQPIAEALALHLENPEVTSVIAGFSSVEQLKEVLDTMEGWRS